MWSMFRKREILTRVTSLPLRCAAQVTGAPLPGGPNARPPPNMYGTPPNAREITDSSASPWAHRDPPPTTPPRNPAARPDPRYNTPGRPQPPSPHFAAPPPPPAAYAAPSPAADRRYGAGGEAPPYAMGPGGYYAEASAPTAPGSRGPSPMKQVLAKLFFSLWRGICEVVAVRVVCGRTGRMSFCFSCDPRRPQQQPRHPHSVPSTPPPHPHRAQPQPNQRSSNSMAATLALPPPNRPRSLSTGSYNAELHGHRNPHQDTAGGYGAAAAAAAAPKGNALRVRRSDAWARMVTYEAVWQICLNAAINSRPESESFLQDGCVLLKRSFGLAAMTLRSVAPVMTPEGDIVQEEIPNIIWEDDDGERRDLHAR